MAEQHTSVLDGLVEEAIRLGGDALDIDADGGYEQVCVMRGAMGCGLARFESSTPEAKALREELHQVARKARRVSIAGRQYVLTCRVRDSFGEDAFCVEIRRRQSFTPKQGQYLAFIYYYTKIHGRAPAETDFQTHFRVTPPAAHPMIVTLEDRGLIDRTPGQARSIRLRIPRSELPDLD